MMFQQGLLLLWALRMLDFEEDEFTGSPVLPGLESEARRMLSQRLNSLEYYELDALVGDILTSSSMQTLSLRNYLVSGSQVPRLIARELPEGGTGDSIRWDLLPDLSELTVHLSRWLNDELDQLVYVGPLREYPERYYIFSGNVPSQVGKSGRLLPDLLYSQRKLEEQISYIFKSFAVGYSLKITRSKDDVFRLQLKDERTGTVVSMVDVGFGISQVLPIIVQSAVSRDNILLIEQPELHLHPRLQAELGTLFAESARDRGNQFIIETHSEHLILRIQRLIREGKLKNSDVSVVYVMKGEEGSRCYPLRLDEEGDFIDEWPEGFFEEGYREMFA